MEVGNYYMSTGQDTLRGSSCLIAGKPQVKRSVYTSGPPLSPQTRTENETSISGTLQQTVKSQDHYYIRKKSLENQGIINDSTLWLKPRPDYFLQQIEVHPKGVMLPSLPAHTRSADWFTMVVFISLALIAIVRISSQKYLSYLFQSITSYTASYRLFREQNISLKQGSAIMELFFYVVIALFGFQLISYLGTDLPFPGYAIYLAFFIIVLLYFQLKHLIYRTLGFVVESMADTREYLFNVNNHNKVLAILLLPLVGFTAWAPFRNPRIFLYFGMILIALFYLAYLLRGMKILLKKQYSIFYLFLYLCTLEFLPLLLLIKLI